MDPGAVLQFTDSYTHGCASGPDAVLACREIIDRCAREFSNNYHDRQDLAADITFALLCYDKPVTHPNQFIHRIARNLVINRSLYGSRAWETSETDLIKAYADGEQFSPMDQAASQSTCCSDPSMQVLVRDSLLRLQKMLTPGERKCYQLLKRGYEQEDLPALLGVTKQAVSKLMKSIREKLTRVEGC